MKEMSFPNEIIVAKPKVAYETASQMPISHQTENEAPPEMKHSPVTNWNSLTWLCYLCEESFNGFEHLSTHRESFHKDRNKEKDHFICFDCKETFSEYSIFLNHIRCRHYNSLKLCCDVCNKVVPDYAQLADHREEHIEYTNEIHPNVYHCNLCEEVAATERILKLHTQEYHDLKSRDATKEKDLSDLSEAEKIKYECPEDMEDESVVEDCVKCEEEYNDTEELFQCGQCVQNFKTESSLKRHLETHNSEQPLKYDVCSQTFTTKAHLNIHMATHKSERPFKCDVCSKKFTAKRHLKQHMITHNSERPFKCDVCSKNFTAKTHLKIHMTTHSNERPFKCDVCSKTFTSKRHLKQHMITHNSERPFKCDVCSKKFTAKRHLKIHVTTHSNERPFKCDVCSKRFIIKAHLKGHMITHNKERPFECDVCSKTFKIKRILKKHMFTHSDQFDFKCAICPKAFKSDFYLKDHMSTHNSERTFQCNVCSRAFTRKMYLKHHMIIHNSEPPFKSDICSKMFKRRHSLDESLNSSYSNEIVKQKISTGEFKLSKIKGRSKVWEVFDKVVDNTGTEIPNIAVCHKCLKVCRHNLNSTSNLVKHKCYVKSLYQNDILPKIEVDTQRKKEGVILPKVEVDTQRKKGVILPKVAVDTQRKKEGVIVFAEWVVQNCRPFHILEDEGFKKVAEFLISIGAEYGKNVDVDKLLPNPTTVSRNIDKIYKIHFEKVKEEIGIIKNIGFGLTTNIWTDNYLKKHYLALTMHFIRKGKLVCRLLGMKAMEEKCTNDRILVKVINLLQEYDCELNEQVTMVTERGANMIAAFRGKNHLYCVNHLLHNALQKSMHEVNEIAELCQMSTKLVKYFKSTALNSSLSTMLESFSPTRWNTIYYVFTSIERNWGEINNILYERNELIRISNININSLKELIQLLQPFEETFKKLEGQEYPTIHLTCLFIFRLKNKCVILSEDSDLTKKFKEKLRLFLETVVIKNLTIFHKVAIFLFPPTNKLIPFEEHEKLHIKEECEAMMQRYLDAEPTNQVEEHSNTNSLSTLNIELLAGFAEGPENLTSDDQISKEIRNYSNLNIKFHDDFDVITWWELHKEEFPLLFKVSCKILSVPATSVASERVFSLAGILLSEKRTSLALNDDMTNQAMFLKFNISQNEITNDLRSEV